ncbi:MAG TPA: glycosyltransferase [Pyrinomonadaceae bacterium]|jgi:glycosyltransferase involved in cell wall biosynthesis
MNSQIAVVVSGFPRRSETFMLGELLTLERRGRLAAVFATKLGETSQAQPGTERLTKYVEFLPDASIEEQARVVRAMLARKKINGIHGYFAHSPAELAERAAQMLGVPFGFSVHARDFRKVAPEVLAQRARAAACVVACNSDVARDVRELGHAVHLLPHGVDLQRFTPAVCSPDSVLRLLAVGRFVEKKGFHFLIAALTRLKLPFRLTIAGDGPERERLRHLITLNNLENRIVFYGSVTHAELPRMYADADVVVVPSVQDSSGDRDGLPNVVLEAMASGRPVIASDVGAITSAITHDENGLLVPPADPVALSQAIRRLAEDRNLRERLGRNGRKRAERDYEVGRCSERFSQLLMSVYA